MRADESSQNVKRRCSKRPIQPSFRISRHRQTRRRAVGLLTLALGMTIGAQSQAQLGWIWQNPLPQGNHLFAVVAFDSQAITAVGEGGTILRTSDGGASWTRQSSGTTHDLYGVSFSTPSNGIAV